MTDARTRIGAIGLAFFMAGDLSAAETACSCQCIGGVMQLSCNAADDIRFACQPTRCVVRSPLSGSAGRAGVPPRLPAMIEPGCKNPLAGSRSMDTKGLAGALRLSGCRTQALDSIKVDRLDRGPSLRSR